MQRNQCLRTHCRELGKFAGGGGGGGGSVGQAEVKFEESK